MSAFLAVSCWGAVGKATKLYGQTRRSPDPPPARRQQRWDDPGMRNPLIRYAATALLLASAGAIQAEQAVEQPKAHHRVGGFQNRHLDFSPKTLSELLQWRLDAWRQDLPPSPKRPVPTVTADRGFIDANARAGDAMQPAITWIGHATILAQLGGLNVLTDPIFSERASPLSGVGPRRAQPPALSPAELPRIDVVVIATTTTTTSTRPASRPSMRSRAGRRCSSCRSASRPGWPTPASAARSSSTGGRLIKCAVRPAPSSSC